MWSLAFYQVSDMAALLGPLFHFGGVATNGKGWVMAMIVLSIPLGMTVLLVSMEFLVKRPFANPTCFLHRICNLMLVCLRLSLTKLN